MLSASFHLLRIVCHLLTFASLYGSGSLYAPAVANDLFACCETRVVWEESRPVVARSRDVLLRAMLSCVIDDAWIWSVLGERNGMWDDSILNTILFRTIVPMSIHRRCHRHAHHHVHVCVTKDGWKLESRFGIRTVARELA